MNSEEFEIRPAAVAIRIKTLRTYFKYNALDFSLKCDLSPLVILKAEAGFTKPQKRTLEKIALAFGTTKNWLLSGEGRMLDTQTD